MAQMKTKWLAAKAVMGEGRKIQGKLDKDTTRRRHCKEEVRFLTILHAANPGVAEKEIVHFLDFGAALHFLELNMKMHFIVFGPNIKESGSTQGAVCAAPRTFPLARELKSYNVRLENQDPSSVEISPQQCRLKIRRDLQCTQT